MRVRAWPAGLLITASRTRQPWTPTTTDMGATLARRSKGLFSCTQGERPRISTLGAFLFTTPWVSSVAISSVAVAHFRHARSSQPSSRHARRPPSALAMGEVIVSTDGGDSLNGAGGVSLWLDMRTAAFPAAQTLQTLYDDLRQREIALGRSPDDPDWALRRVPSPVGALLYATEPVERAANENKALGGFLPCFQLGADNDRVLEVSSGEVVGVELDPLGAKGAGPGAGAAAAAVAAAQEAEGNVVLLRGVKPSSWEDEDMATVLQIAASACAGSGKTLAVTVRSVGQLHDAAMAALLASQTQVLGQKKGEGGGAGKLALVIEPMSDLWEAGLMYL